MQFSEIRFSIKVSVHQHQTSGAQERLPWQHRLPRNGATKSALYDRMYENRKGL